MLQATPQTAMVDNLNHIALGDQIRFYIKKIACIKVEIKQALETIRQI